MKRRAILLATAFMLAAGPVRAGLKLRWDVSSLSTDTKSYAYGMVQDASGDLYVVGSENYSAVNDLYHGRIWRVSSYLQCILWSRTSDGVGTTVFADSLKAVVADPDGDGVIAGGGFWDGVAAQSKAILYSYNSLGTTDYTVEPPADSIEGIAVSGTSYFFMAGPATKVSACAPGTVDTDIWVGKYDTSGAKLDDTTVTDVFCVDDKATGVAVARDGSVYVSGYRTVSGQGKDIWLGKFNPNNLATIWSITIDGAAHGDDYATGLALDSSGNVYLSGSATAKTAGYADDPDVWAGKVVDNGTYATVAWTWSRDGGSRDRDEAMGCAVDSSGNVWISGYLDTEDPTWEDMWMAKLSGDGVPLLQYVGNGTGQGKDIFQSIIIGSDGYPIVAGTQDVITKGESMYVAKFWEYIPEPAPPPDGVTGYPNPFRPGSGGAQDAVGMVFRGLEPRSSLRLYTLAGFQVVELDDADGDGEVFWDGKNASHKDVGSGVYIFSAKSASSGATKGRVVIIR